MRIQALLLIPIIITTPTPTNHRTRIAEEDSEAEEEEDSEEEVEEDLEVEEDSEEVEEEVVIEEDSTTRRVVRIPTTLTRILTPMVKATLTNKLVLEVDDPETKREERINQITEPNRRQLCSLPTSPSLWTMLDLAKYSLITD